jgi:hypothetical protein
MKKPVQLREPIVQVEQLRLQRPDQEFNAREAVAETNLLFGHIQ